MAQKHPVAATALDMTARQRNISVSEFFLKNRHLRPSGWSQRSNSSDVYLR
ncbi:MAG: hypothetical protein WCA36_21755 [Pseudolabrys sp.]